MTSTTDVLMSFLGDLDSEPDFFFPDPDVDNDMNLNNFDGDDKLEHMFREKGGDIISIGCGRNDSESSTGSPSSLDYDAIELPYDMTEMVRDDEDRDHDLINVIPSKKRERHDDYASNAIYITNDRCMKFPKLKKKKGKHTPKVKKAKLTVEEKMRSLVQILKNMRKTIDRPPSQEVSIDEPTLAPESQLDSAFSMAEDFLFCVFSGKSRSGCTPNDLSDSVESNGTLYVPALASLFSLAQSKRSENNLSAWAPVSDGVEIFPERHFGVGQIAAASRCFARTLSDLITEDVYKNTEASIVVKRTAMSHGNQLIAPFVWKCKRTESNSEGIEFSGLIRCTVGSSKFSFVHISFDAFTIIRQCEKLAVPIVAAVGEN